MTSAPHPAGDDAQGNHPQPRHVNINDFAAALGTVCLMFIGAVAAWHFVAHGDGLSFAITQASPWLMVILNREMPT